MARDTLQSPSDHAQPPSKGETAKEGARTNAGDRLTPGGELAAPPTHAGAEAAAAEGEEA